MTQEDEQKEDNDYIDNTSDHSDNNDNDDDVHHGNHDYLDDINDDLEDLLDNDAPDDDLDEKLTNISLQDDIFNDVAPTAEVQSDKSSNNSVKTVVNHEVDVLKETSGEQICTPKMNKYETRKDFFQRFFG